MGLRSLSDKRRNSVISCSRRTKKKVSSRYLYHIISSYVILFNGLIGNKVVPMYFARPSLKSIRTTKPVMPLKSKSSLLLRSLVELRAVSCDIMVHVLCPRFRLISMSYLHGVWLARLLMGFSYL